MDLATKGQHLSISAMMVDSDHGEGGGMRVVLGGSSPLVPVRETFEFKESHDAEELNYATKKEAVVVPPPPRLRRYQSAPIPQKSPQRRSIFGKELGVNKRTMRNTTPPQRKRATSISTIPATPEVEESTNMSLLAMLSRPKSLTRLEERPHFCDVTAVPPNLLQQLPKLPTPFLRFHDGNRCQYLGGMYPLIQPDSILRHKEDLVVEESSHDSEGASSLEDGSYDANQNPPPIPAPSALNLTQSVRYMGPGQRDHQQRKLSAVAMMGPARKIKFDPRVTVTEFEDDPEYRQWFSDYELESFKKETIALAQQYLVKHPTVLEDYCKPYLDPVTGTFRKKALFSMLVLKATRAEDSLDEIQSESSQKRYDEMRQELANTTFRKILLVHRNKLVLDLFERSLTKIFPKAQFSRCETGDEALQLAHNARGGTFDLVLAEDRTHRPWKSCDGLDMGAEKAAAAQEQEHAFSNVSKTASMGGLTKNAKNAPLIITDLFRMIRGMERLEKKDQAMLVAVSTDPDSNRLNLQASGADAVWGLPPPHMSENLRDELVARILQKRRGDPPKQHVAFPVPCHPQG